MNKTGATAAQRRQLIDFLKGCRARLTPAQVGLPDTNRRRTPGLRREDVAALAGVSVTWYTWLEQGRDIQVSAEVLERIATTLRMTNDEREYLFALVQHRPAPPAAANADTVSPAVRRTLDAVAVPAIVLTRRWDIVAWNELARRLLRDYAAMPAERRNLLRLLLLDDLAYQRDAAAYETMVQRLLAKFRVDYSQAVDDPSFEELIGELDAGCALFRKYWGHAQVVAKLEAVVQLPQAAGITFEHSSYVIEGTPNLRLVLFAPYDEASAAKLRAAAAQTAGDTAKR